MRIINKPWGKEIWWAELPDRYLGKILYINEGFRLSLQYHKFKDETLYVLHGLVEFEVSGIKTLKYPGESIHIPHQTVHRMKAIQYAEIVEVSTYYPEDVVRLADDHNRIGDNDATL